MKLGKINYLLIGMLLHSIGIFAQESKPTIREVVETLEKAVIAKDISLLQGVIADNFAISTTTWPASENLLKAIFSRKTIEYVRLVSDVPVPVGKNYQKVVALIKETEKKESETGIILDQDNRIVYVDYFDWICGRNRYQESTLQAKIPIMVTQTGSILMNIRINDHPKEFLFLFDSGSDGMAISRNMADSLGLKVGGDQQVSVVGGNMPVSISFGNTIHLDTLKLTNQNIALFERVRPGIDGLIGLNILKAYIAKFDLDENFLSLYNFGKYVSDSGSVAVDVITPANIPLVSGSIDLTGNGYVNGRFTFDTGASYYLIGFSSFVRENKLLVNGFQPESQTATVSFGKPTPTFNGKCVDFKIDHFHLKSMPVSLQAGENWNARADGSLGVRFISRYNFTINLLEKEIYLVENKRSQLPVE